MRVVLFGATGMIGQGVLLECLADPDVTHVLSIGRRTTDVQHAKLTQIVHDNFTDYSAIGEQLAGFDACFFCLGASSVGMSEEHYRHITYDFTLAAAQALLARSPDLVFCYVSASGPHSALNDRTPAEAYTDDGADGSPRGYAPVPVSPRSLES